MSLTAAEVWRNYVTDGVPGSGINKPSKVDIRAWGTVLETLVASGAAGLAYATISQISADLNHPANSLAIVYADSTPANNGMYVKSGVSGAGSWSRIGDLPGDVIRLTVTGGTANAIVATAPETPSTPGSKLYLMTPTLQNTAATTLAVNGATPAAITNAFGSALASGSLLANSQVLMAWAVDHYQLLISANVDASAILASAQAADVSANNAATNAASSASSAAASAGVLIFPTVAAYAAATVSLADNTMIYIHNYYAGVDGGGHWCRIKSSPPTHTAYHVSANSKYAVLTEINPDFRMLGAQPYGVTADCTPYLDMWQDYCDANISCSSLRIPTGNWTFTTLPRPIFVQGAPWGRTIVGDGMQNTLLYTNYSTSSFLGFFHLLPNANGGGMSIGNLQVISQKTDFSNGAAIASHSGYVTTVKVGAPTTGNVLTITIAGTAITYTVIAGDNARNCAAFLALNINNNATIFNAYNIAIAVKDTVVILSRSSAPPTITVSSSGATTMTKTTVGAQTSGYITMNNLNVSAANGWSYSIRFDGVRQDISPLGIRSIFANNCNFFGAQQKSVSLFGCAGAQFTNCTVVQAGGTSGTLEINGTSFQKCQNIYWSGGAVNDILLDFAAFGTIVLGTVPTNVLNTSNTDSYKIIGRIQGTAQTNWTNSGYL